MRADEKKGPTLQRALEGIPAPVGDEESEETIVTN